MSLKTKLKKLSLDLNLEAQLETTSRAHGCISCLPDLASTGDAAYFHST